MPLTSNMSYFLSALLLLCWCYLDSMYVQVVVMVVGCIWLVSIKEYGSIVIVFVCLLLMNIQSFNYSMDGTIQGKVIQKKDGYVVVDVGNYNVLVYDVDVKFDDVVYIEGEAKEIVSLKNRVGFSFSDWCSARNIVYAIYPSEVDVIKNGNSLRSKVSNKLVSLDNKAQSVIRMFLFHDYDEEIEWLYLGLSFGIHIAFVIQMITSFFHYFLLEDKVDSIELVIHLLFCMFYQFDFITVRLLLKCILKKSKLSKHNQWGCLVILLCILYPKMVAQQAFVLPVCIGLLNVFSHKKVIGSIELLILWIQLVNNGFVAIGQIVFSKGIRYIFCLVYSLCFLNIWISTEALLILIYDVIHYIGNIQFYCILLGKPNIVLSCIFLAYLIKYVHLPCRKYFLYVCLLFVINHFQGYLYPFARVVYIDVGQGDCTLITLPFNRGNILIDTGGSLYSDIAKEVVYPVISSYGISNLDLVLLTHDDLDHSGAFESLDGLITIGKVIQDKHEKYIVGNFEMYDLLYDQEFEDGNENSLTCCFSIYESSFLLLGDIHSEQEELLVREYDNLHIDYLKLAHHGSNTSTSDHLLESIRCDYAIISCGKNNRYKHPSLEVVERLNGFKIDSLLTSEVGMVEVIVTPFLDCIKMENEVILKYKCP